MKTILIHSIVDGNNGMFDDNERDGSKGPWIYLRDRLYKLGYELKTSDNNAPNDCEWVIFVDSSTYTGWRGLALKLKTKLKRRSLFKDFYYKCIQAGMQQRMALFLWENPAVIPENWDSELHKMFPLIFTWHDYYVDGRKFVKFCLPVTHLFPRVPKIPFADKKLLVNISGNKFSNHPQELYSARRRSIRYFQQKQPRNFDLYGVGWDQPTNILERIIPGLRQNYPSYRGKLQNKWNVLPNYRFSLCYENISSEPGYITEKIFDCMRSGCVPIYWGAPNIDEYVEPQTFIDRRKFKSDPELELYLLSITEKKYERFQEAIQDYLQSERFAKFLSPAYADTVINGLKLSI